MAFNVNQFRQQITGDGARPNLFEIQMNVPGYAKVGDVDRKLTFMCNSAQLPGSSIGVAPTFYFGREVKLAGNRTYPEWSINVYNDEDFVIRNAMERWINGINDPVFNIRSVAAGTVDNGYGVDARVTQFGKAGSSIKKYNFVGMFPIDISPIELSWQANDQIEEFSITFAYQYWTSEERELSNAIGTLGSLLGA
jgi:hypothetical protein